MFVTLDAAYSIPRAVVLGYRFTDAPGELWTQRFNRFKAGDETAVRAGIATMRNLLETLPQPTAPTVVIGVPGSGETELGKDKPVGRLASAIAEHWGVTLDLGLVKKRVHSPIHSKRIIEEREKILDEAKYKTEYYYTDIENYILVDDFITRGATMERIAGVVRKDVRHAKFLAIAVAKTERLQYWKNLRNMDLKNTDAERYERDWVKLDPAK